jgi:hypothetical protein
VVDTELQDNGLRHKKGEYKIAKEGGNVAERTAELMGEVHLLAGICLLSGGNALRDALETLGLVLLGLRLVPWKR